MYFKHIKRYIYNDIHILINSKIDKSNFRKTVIIFKRTVEMFKLLLEFVEIYQYPFYIHIVTVISFSIFA